MSRNALDSHVPKKFYVLILAAVTGLVYANTLWNGFTVDDPFTYSQNNFIKDLRNLPDLFTSHYFQ